MLNTKSCIHSVAPEYVLPTHDVLMLAAADAGRFVVNRVGTRSAPPPTARACRRVMPGLSFMSESLASGQER
jgi:hypothetical protein